MATTAHEAQRTGEHRTLLTLLDRAADRFADRPALIDADHALTWADARSVLADGSASGDGPVAQTLAVLSDLARGEVFDFTDTSAPLPPRTDMVFPATRADGSVYFTNPGGRIAPEDREIDFSGVHRIAPDGSVAAVTAELNFPNGLAFSPDESILYVAITRRDDGCIQEKERGEECTHQLIRVFDVTGDGSLSNDRVFANMFSSQDGVPDGMKVDSEGKVYCTGSEGCWVFDASGAHLGIIRLPEIPANCAWGGPDHVLHCPHFGLHHANDHPWNPDTQGLMIRSRRQQFPISGFQ